MQDHRSDGGVDKICDFEPVDLLALKAEPTWTGAVLDIVVTTKPAPGGRHIDEVRLEQFQELRRRPLQERNGLAPPYSTGQHIF